MQATYSNHGGADEFKVSKIEIEYGCPKAQKVVMISFIALNHLAQCIDVSMSLKEFKDFCEEAERILSHSMEGGCVSCKGFVYP